MPCKISAGVMLVIYRLVATYAWSKIAGDNLGTLLSKHQAQVTLRTSTLYDEIL
jgi:hypothetical protein